MGKGDGSEFRRAQGGGLLYICQPPGVWETAVLSGDNSGLRHQAVNGFRFHFNF